MNFNILYMEHGINSTPVEYVHYYYFVSLAIRTSQNYLKNIRFLPIRHPR